MFTLTGFAWNFVISNLFAYVQELFQVSGLEYDHLVPLLYGQHPMETI